MKVDPVSVAASASSDGVSPADLRGRLGAELAAPRWHLRFEPVLEARFEAETGASRRRELMVNGLIGLAVYDLFLVNDLLLRPDDVVAALFWRLGVLTVYGLAALLLIRRGLPAHAREWLMGSTIVVAALASSAIFGQSRSPASAYDPFVFSLVFVAGNVAFPLRFVQAAVTSLLGIAVTAAFIVPSPILVPEAKVFALAMIVGGAFFTLGAAYRVEAWGRRTYLLTLRETLRTEEVTQVADELALLSTTDALTDVGNRRGFDAALARAWFEQGEIGGGVALLMVDVDHFKRFNDRFGHPRGDTCLRELAHAMRGELRGNDYLARVGGEEFAVLLQAAGPGSARALAERLRARVEALAIAHDGLDGQAVVTVSVGVAVQVPGLEVAPSALVEAADRALYQAKRAGRNRVAS